ncbi:hypothetical protein [Cohaesibacter gelatinilyticus]|uniref:O-Antigen ligase n=1 Tax=Cohaesibacter gelatinilyticus TaxID=372072 RepID=A0A285PHD7_9HYPH|nr:hypothetical protein [Cohaesibacter gelatinilyticus]SNZ20657.1 hypothetical protein SAMN06265368_3767 [Cohaesibacter gelatinilyticus]HAT85409.1 hypothetical protein [Hyphomicrobiales bacterium]
MSTLVNNQMQHAASPYQPVSGHAIERLAIQTSHLSLTLALCLLVTTFPIAAFFISPLIAIIGHLILVSAVTFYFAPALPQIVYFALLFQNIIISIFSGFVSDAESFNILKGFNFLTMMVAWLWLFGSYAMNWRVHSRQVNRIMAVGLIAFAIIGFYLLLGMAKNPMAASIYLRNIITPMVMFQLFFFVALRFNQPLLPFFTTVTVIVIIAGWIEMLDRPLWLDLTNGWTYWGKIMEKDILNLSWDQDAKEKGQVLLGILDSMRVDFLNTPLLGDNSIKITRMNGPNLHPISYSYALSILALIMWFSKRGWWVLPLLPLLLLASAKGSMIMIFLAFCALLARFLFGAVFGLVSLVFVLVCYFVLGIIIGLDIGDFHVLGFMGGVYDFLGNPIGYGLGDGGNLATNFGKLDWSAYQAAGRTPTAMESAVGVMMRQMGFAAFALLACYAWIGYQTFKLSLQSKVALHSIASFGLFIILVNGVFQEEALFSPLALGSMMALNGHILGASLRAVR